MSKKYFEGVLSVPDLSTNPMPVRVYTLRIANGVVYGLDSHPYNYLYRRTSTSRNRWLYAELTTARDTTTEVTLCVEGTPNPNISALFYAFDESAIGYGAEVSTSVINESRKIKRLKVVNFITSVYYETLAGAYTVPIIIDFTINNVLYKGFIITGTHSGHTFSGSNIQLIKADESIESYSIQDFGSTYNDAIIEFSPDAMPSAISEWWLSITEGVYTYTYSIKDYTGDSVLSELVESPPMTHANLTVLANQKTLTLTGSNGQTYTMQWESETPEGQIFLGLSTSPNSNRPTLLANTETTVSWVGNLTFYEAYGTYRPPTTVFDINLYQNTAEPNRVDKGTFLTGVGTLSGALREECSLLTPSIVYQSSDVPTFNYVYIPIFNRYYFVKYLSSVGKNLWRMELNCDVLMTYKDSIFLLQGVIARQQFDFNEYLVDSEIPTQDDPNVTILNIPSTVFKPRTNVADSFYNFVLTVIG